MTPAVVIVQARMGSTRLPGKVLKPIAGRSMLSYQIERLRRAKHARRIVVATSISAADEAIVRFCRAEGVECSRGSETDVLSRYYEAAIQFDARAIVRLTGDCPLIDPQLIDMAVDAFSGADEVDYVSNMLEPSWPYGMAVEVVSAGALAEAYREARDPVEREHVTPFIYWRPQRYRLRSLRTTPNLSHHRWTVDTSEDFILVSRVFESLYPNKPDFGMQDVLSLLDANPEWVNLNRHVRQTVVTPSEEKTDVL